MINIFENKILISNQINIVWLVDGVFTATITGTSTENFESYDELFLKSVLINFNPYFTGSNAGLLPDETRICNNLLDIIPGDITPIITLSYNTFNVFNLEVVSYKDLTVIDVNTKLLSSQRLRNFILNVSLTTTDLQADLQALIAGYTTQKYGIAFNADRKIGFRLNYLIVLEKPEISKSGSSIYR